MTTAPSSYTDPIQNPSADGVAPRIVRLVWHPNELGLAQAYVTGEINVVGDVADGLAHVQSLRQDDQIVAVRPGPGAPGGRR